MNWLGSKGVGLIKQQAVKGWQPWLIFGLGLMLSVVSYAEPWQRDKTYYQGMVVDFHNGQYLAAQQNINIEPSANPKVWQHISTTVGKALIEAPSAWSSRTYYDRADIVVTHKGKLWRNAFPTLGEVPGKIGVQVWNAIGLDFDGPPSYTNYAIYEPGNVVVWNSMLWESVAYVIGEQPGQSSAWVLVGFTTNPLSSPPEHDSADVATAANQGQWSADISYLTPNTVIAHKGLLWMNSAPAAAGETPGEPGVDVWYIVGLDRESRIPKWQADSPYPQSQAVAHGQYIWVSRREVHGNDVPGQSAQWLLATVLRSSLPTWQANQLYAAGTSVTLKGKTWVAVQATIGDEPGTEAGVDQWVVQSSSKLSNVFDVRAWQSRDAYPWLGSIVSFADQYWYNVQHLSAAADSPTQSAAWLLLDGDDNTGASAAVAAAIDGSSNQWRNDRTYDVIGTVVTYQGVSYVNNQVTYGGPPPPQNPLVWGALEDKLERDNPGINSLIWQHDAIYADKGQQVTHGGQDWYNLYWTQGEEPGKHGVWQPRTITNGAPWNPLIIYDGPSRGEGGVFYTVSHHGQQWRNRWWTQGDEPGSHVVWQPATIVDGAPWNAFVIYDASTDPERSHYVVSHNGQRWVNAYYTQGDEPGVSPVWTLE